MAKKTTKSEYRKYLDTFGEDYFHERNGHTLSNYGDYNWDRYCGVLKDYINTMLPFFPAGEIKSTLDAGAAKGYIVKMLLEQGFDAKGFDISKFAVEDGIKQFPELEGRMSVNDVTTFEGIPDESFDLVMATEVLEHVQPERTDDALKNIYRVSRKYALFSMPLGEKKGDDDMDVSHINIHPREWWEEKIDKAGFEYVPDSEPHFRGIWNFFPLQKKS